MWQQVVPTTPGVSTPQTFTWPAARAYCPSLTLAGHTDWRLPSETELLSLVDYGVASGVGKPANIDPVAFPGAPAATFWSSTPMQGNSSNAWYVGFNGSGTLTSAVNNQLAVRCVRGPAAIAEATSTRYTVTAGTAYDMRTKLTWQQGPAPAMYTWNDAEAFCSSTVSATFGGAGWRLPTVKELQSLIDYAQPSGATIDQVTFPATAAASFWSSTPVGGFSPSVWLVNFGNGFTFPGLGLPSTDTFNVRCVR
jgi:hypothetical protein